MSNVAGDFGFGYMKMLANNKEVIFPSVAGEPQHSNFSLLAGRNGYDIQVGDDKPWLFGESALLQSSLASRRQDSEWIFSSQYLAGMLVAISECYSRRTDPVVRLVTGLPYNDYSRGKPFLEKFRRCLKGEHEIRRTFGKQKISIESVLIVPQNYGPILRHILKKDGEFHKPEVYDNSLFLGSINIGSHTVELGTCEITPGERMPKLEPIEPQSLSEKKGVYSLLPAIRPLLKEQFLGETFSYHKILKALETGSISLYGKPEPIKNIDRPVSQFNERILGLATQNWSDQMPVPLNSLFALIITGGGANLAASYLKEIGYHPNIVVSDRPQWDTVIGYERLQKLLGKRK